jgi:hypothetical protein
MSDYFGDDSIHVLGHNADFVLAVTLPLVGNALQRFDPAERIVQWLNVRLEAAGTADCPVIGERRATCLYFKSPTWSGADPHVSTAGSQENVPDMSGRPTNPAGPRLEPDRSSVAIL